MREIKKDQGGKKEEKVKHERRETSTHAHTTRHAHAKRRERLSQLTGKKKRESHTPGYPVHVCT